MFKRLFIGLSALLAFASTPADAEYAFKKINTAGLTVAPIREITQDSDQKLWLVTAEGISVFDSLNSRRVIYNGNYIGGVVVDNDLVALRENGLTSISLDNPQYTVRMNPTYEGQSIQGFKSIFEVKGQVVLHTVNNELYVYDVHNRKLGKFPNFSGRSVEAITSDGAGRIVFVSGKNIYAYDGLSFATIHSLDAEYKVHELVINSNQDILALIDGHPSALNGKEFVRLGDFVGFKVFVHNEQFFVAGNQGLALVNGQSLERVLDKEVTAIATDVNGGLLAGTVSGELYYGSEPLFRKKTVTHGLANNEVTALFRGKEQLWVGTYGGLSSYRSGTFVTPDFVNKLESDKIMAVFEFSDKLYIGYHTGGFDIVDVYTGEVDYFGHEQAETTAGVTGFIPFDGKLVVTYFGATVRIFDPKTGSLTSPMGISRLGDLRVFDADFMGGYLYLATSVGLYRMTKDFQTIEFVNDLIEKPNSILSRPIYGLTQLNDASIQLRNDAGVHEIKEIDNGLSLQVDTKSGLSKIEVQSFLATGDRHWLATNYGLYTRNSDGNYVTLANRASEQSIEFNFNAIEQDGNTLLIGAMDGLYFYDLGSELSTYSSVVHFDKVEADFQPVEVDQTSLGSKVQLLSSVTNLKVQLGFTDMHGESFYYLYRISPMYSGYIKTHEPTINLIQLAKGDYTLEVIGCNGFGECQPEPTRMRISVQSSFIEDLYSGKYQMETLGLAAGLMLLLMLYKYKHTRKVEKLQQALNQVDEHRTSNEKLSQTVHILQHNEDHVSEHVLSADGLERRLKNRDIYLHRFSRFLLIKVSGTQKLNESHGWQNTSKILDYVSVCVDRTVTERRSVVAFQMTRTTYGIFHDFEDVDPMIEDMTSALKQFAGIDLLHDVQFADIKADSAKYVDNVQLAETSLDHISDSNNVCIQSLSGTYTISKVS